MRAPFRVSTWLRSRTKKAQIRLAAAGLSGLAVLGACSDSPVASRTDRDDRASIPDPRLAGVVGATDHKILVCVDPTSPPGTYPFSAAPLAPLPFLNVFPLFELMTSNDPDFLSLGIDIIQNSTGPFSAATDNDVITSAVSLTPGNCAEVFVRMNTCPGGFCTGENPFFEHSGNRLWDFGFAIGIVNPYGSVAITAAIPPGYLYTLQCNNDDANLPQNCTNGGYSSANVFHGSIFTYTFTVNTSAGTDISVTPIDPAPIGTAVLSLSFDSITTGGPTTLTSSLLGDPEAPPAPTGFQFGDPAIVYDIQTDAIFTGSIEICIDFGAGTYEDVTGLRLLHYENGAWVDVTSAGYPDAALHLICGTASSLSPFLLGRLHYDVAGFFQPVDNLPAVNIVNAGGAIPVKFSLGGNRGLNVFAEAYPKSRAVTCDVSAPSGDLTETIAASSNTLTYAVGNSQYLYVWRTDKAWVGTCRELMVRFADGQEITAHFRFK